MSSNKSSNYQSVLFLYLIFTVIIAICFFLLGFFPINSFNNDNTSTKNDLPLKINNTSLNPDNLYKPLVQKIVIMVIDSLRWDFVTTLGDGVDKTMYFTNKMLENNFGRLLQVKVNIPTVTMPRIKALTTGTVSNYVDVIFNLGETRVSSDNILLQAQKHGHKLIFYGDDTWLQMFNDMFHRSEGTTSFFVNDFVEVDNNVTRNIYRELKNETDWSIMILHYLGLDHIGHVYGPKSPLIKSKLKEMDNIIEDISTQIIQWNKQNIKSLFIICGDHGMKNTGGHGGATPEETLVPLIAIGDSYDSHSNKNYLNNESVSQIDQIDIPATLAVMLGIPLPSLSVGVVSLDMINYNLSSAQKLYILHYNGLQIFNQFRKLSNFYSKDCYLNYLKAIKLHEEWIHSSSNDNVEEIITLYLHSLTEMKNLLIQSLIYYNLPLISIAIILIAQVLIIMIVSLNEEKFNIFSLKKYYTLWFFTITLWFLLNFILVNSEDNNDKSSNNINLPANYIFIIFILFSINNYLLCTRITLSFHRSIFWSYKFTSLNFVLSLAIGLHAISLGSSSFIEEEHQTWYFYWATFLVNLFIYCFQQSSITKENKNCLLKNMTGKIVLLSVLHRFLRKLNSTGNKYANLPDISGWLKASDYSNALLTIITLIALGLIFYALLIVVNNDRRNHWYQQKEKLIFYSVALLCIYLRHSSEKNIYRLPFYPESRGIHEVQIFWIVCSLYLIYNLKNIICCSTKTDKSLINQLIHLLLQYWVIISAMLHRPYNIILLPIHLMTQTIISDFFHNYANKTSILTFLSYCIGNVFYFYQGNSNSLATIDVAASCVGLETYDIKFAALFVCINTLSSPVLAYLVLIFYSTKGITSSAKDFYRELYAINRQYVIFKLVSLVTYTIIISIERHHLFVWSVFAPKLLYEAVHCAVILSIIFLVKIIIISIKRMYKA